MLKLRQNTTSTATKLNTEALALKITTLTMKYSYAPGLSDIFHLSMEQTAILPYTEMVSSEIFLLPA